ncbi:MAG: Gfo/Idh/MocA family oxidoreductase, partial [Planctomycetota bacterium]|nr:Gfo/Idh/MocA family oxidoreductase [Planctomycetota bacterium]
MQLTRRHFLTGTSSLALASLAPGRSLRKPGRDKIRVGVVGVWNRGRSNLEGVLGEEVVALCDVDERHLGLGAELVEQRTGGSGKALQFKDYRRMLDNPGILDAVVVSTADHTHASVAAAALRRGLHVYCEKPLAHSP